MELILKSAAGTSIGPTKTRLAEEYKDVESETIAIVFCSILKLPISPAISSHEYDLFGHATILRPAAEPLCKYRNGPVKFAPLKK